MAGNWKSIGSIGNLPDQIRRRMDEKIQKDAADLADGILGFFGLGKDKEEEANRRRRAAKQNWINDDTSGW